MRSRHFISSIKKILHFQCRHSPLLISFTENLLDKISLPNRYNVSLDKSFACIIHHSRDCETEELIFSLASHSYSFFLFL